MTFVFWSISFESGNEMCFERERAKRFERAMEEKVDTHDSRRTTTTTTKKATKEEEGFM